MRKYHIVKNISFNGDYINLIVDGKKYQVDLSEQSIKLLKACDKERNNYKISGSGYGIHWPDLDEDLSIDGLIEVKHKYKIKVTV